MKIGLLVDGDAEYHALPKLLSRLESPHQVLSQPLKCDIQPFATPAQMALAASKKFQIDKETRPDCTVELVRAVEREARKRLREMSTTVDLQVVLKISMFENWLIADPEALGGLAGLFEKVERIEKQVGKGRADSADALSLLKACSRERVYDKVKGAMAICPRLDPIRAAGNSRSFRKFMKALEVPQRGPSPRRPSSRGKR